MDTETEIFNAYLDDKCPVCHGYVSDAGGAETTRGGKVQSIELECENCLTSYRVGFNRGVNPVASEILSDNH